MRGGSVLFLSIEIEEIDFLLFFVGGGDFRLFGFTRIQNNCVVNCHDLLLLISTLTLHYFRKLYLYP